jgi:hypothetical protein
MVVLIVECPRSSFTVTRSTPERVSRVAGVDEAVHDLQQATYVNRLSAHPALASLMRWHLPPAGVARREGADQHADILVHPALCFGCHGIEDDRRFAGTRDACEDRDLAFGEGSY